MSISPYLKRLRAQIGHDLVQLPSVAVLPWDDDGRLLMVREAQTGLWQTIGGAVEPDESPQDAALRETAEEAGVRVQLDRIRAVTGGPQYRLLYPNGDLVSYVTIIFDARVIDGRPRPDGDETLATAWLSRAELVQAELSPFTIALLGDPLPDRSSPADSGVEADMTMPSQIDPVASRVRAALQTSCLTVVGEDLTRPWGGFLLIAQVDLQQFIRVHFASAGLHSDGEPSTKMSPKVLLVAPGMRLSWQYHLRRSEIWRIVEGPVAISRGPDDYEPAARNHDAGEVLHLELGERHRLTGLDTWGVVAEIWQHADPASPSDERDIVRVADDHRRA